MSAVAHPSPLAGPRSGGIAARRAVIRWAQRMFRREWRQQLLVLTLLAGPAWWFVNRDKDGEDVGTTIGYADGSSVTLDASSPELDRLVQIASGAVAS